VAFGTGVLFFGKIMDENDDVTAPTISIIYDGAGHDQDPGVWHIIVEDLESGLSEVQILVDGAEVFFDDMLNGILTFSHDVSVPGSRGYHTITVMAKNDITFDGTQETHIEELITRIDAYVPPLPPPEPPPPVIN